MRNRREARVAAVGVGRAESERIVVGIAGSTASLAALKRGIRLSRVLGLSMTPIATGQEGDVVLDFPTRDPITPQQLVAR